MSAGSGSDSVEFEYEPRVDRLSVERRVLGHITDDDHVGRGPRNTMERLDQELNEDPNTPYAGNVEQLEGYIATLIEEELVIEREDGTLEVTDAGKEELRN